jgi:hypothetical protein
MNFVFISQFDPPTSPLEGWGGDFVFNCEELDLRIIYDRYS